MSDFINRISDIGGGNLTEGVDPDTLVAADGVRTYVLDEAEIQYVVVGKDELTRRTDDWETVEHPGDGYGCMFVVTDYSVTILVGDCRDPDVDGDYVNTIQLGDVTSTDVKDSLFSTQFTLTDGEGVQFVIEPVTDDGLFDIVDFVQKASDRWETAGPVLEEFDQSVERIETALANGRADEAREARSEATKTVSKIGETSFRQNTEIPLLENQIQSAKNAIDVAQVRGHSRYSEFRMTEAAAVTGGDPDSSAIQHYREAADALESAVEVKRASGISAADVETGSDDPVPELPPLATDIRDALDTAQGWDWECVDPEDRVTGLRGLLDGYDTMASVAPDIGPLDQEGLVDSRNAVARRLARALERAFDHAESEGDELYDDGDEEGARAAFERAIDCVRQRNDLAEQYPDAGLGIDQSNLADERERLEEKHERTMWVWGGE